MSDEIHDEPGANASSPPAARAAAEQDLKATADSIRADAGRLATIEDDKLALDADDPEVGRLSDKAVELAERIVQQTTAERQLSQEIG
jgi:hypothetical protein